MSEQVITDEDAQQTDVRGFLRKLRKGEPINTEATSTLLNRIYNILEGLAGEGCRVDKPLDCKGLGWRIIVDGCYSDLEPMGRVPMPFEFIAVDNAWHVWLKDAEVVLNNYHASKADNLQTAGDLWTAATYAPNSNVYLYVFESSATDTKHGANCYSWNVSTSVPSGALASVLLGRVASSTLAVQNARGNQILYTFADSEIIKHDALNSVCHVNTTSASGAMPVDEHLAFVVRHGGVLKYYKATDLLEAAFKKFEELIRQEPDPETDPSDVLPIGDETYDEWEARIKGEIRKCLEDDGWPYQPLYGTSQYPEESSSTFGFYGGWGEYDPISDKFVSYWRGIPSGKLTENHIPERTELNEILNKMQLIKTRIDALTEDPDGILGPNQSPLDNLADAADEATEAASSMAADLSAVNGMATIIDAKLTQAYTLIQDCQQRASAIAARQAAIDADVTELEGRI